MTEGPLSREEVEDFQELRRLLRPTESLAILDDFSKWLFGSAAAVGSLGAGFGVSGLNHLAGVGKDCFVAAVICLGVSLAVAALTRLPRHVLVQRTSPKSMRSALENVVLWRYRTALAAAGLFATGLVLAAVAPVLS